MVDVLEPNGNGETLESQNGPLCVQAGYLPVPLACVPPESLAKLAIYIRSKEGYSLYTSKDLHFSQNDVLRLQESNVEYVYVSVKDHREYYQTIEQAIDQIISSSNIKEEKKSEILYNTSIELSNQLLSAPPGKEELRRSTNVARATVNLIMKDKQAFGRLYEVFNHDFYTASHLVNVCGMSITLAQEMGLVDVDILQHIGTGGLLHDIGKIFISENLLNNAEKLTNEQFDMMKTHVDHGIQHLETVMILPDEIRAVIAEHHERMDGSGYPKGLKQDQISPLGRLAGVVDTFDAMTSVRPYRDHTYSVEEALDFLQHESGALYDGEIVHAFSSMIKTNMPLQGDRDAEAIKTRSRAASAIDEDRNGKHVQYYFRIPILIKRVKKVNGKITVGPEEKVIAHKLSCVGIGLLSDRPFGLNENIVMISPALKEIALENILAVVTHCHNHEDGWYTVNGQFHRPQPPDVIEKIKSVTVVREKSPLVNS